MKQKGLIITGVLAVLIGLGALIFSKMQDAKQTDAARTEILAQESERKECQRRLMLFYTAWKQYKQDHKGAEPASIDSLIPRYIKDTKLLYCPTAARWEQNHRALDQGSVKIGKDTFPETYGFQWLTANYAHSFKTLKERTPLITCDSHRQAIYVAVFKKVPRLNAFDPEQSQKYPDELRTATTLAVLENGTVTDLAPEK